MAKYRKKPVVIEAFEWTGGREQIEDPEWFVDALKSGKARIFTETEEVSYYDGEEKSEEVIVMSWVEIETLEGTMTALQGDYIIQGVKGEIYPCKPDVFEQSYEPVG